MQCHYIVSLLLPQFAARNSEISVFCTVVNEGKVYFADCRILKKMYFADFYMWKFFVD